MSACWSAQVAPGQCLDAAPSETKSFTFKASAEGLFVCHCAVPMVSNHKRHGLIQVEPAGRPAKGMIANYVL
jgi:hypothetical protein